MSVHAAVISTLSGRNKISTGMEVNGRLEEQGGDEVVGVFNNMVPLFYDLNNLSWIELCNMSLNIEDKIMPFRRYPYTEMHKNNNGPIFDTLFVFTHFHNYTKLFDVENITIHDHYASDQTYIPLTAHFNLSVDKSHLSLFLDYESNMYTEAEAQRIAGIYKKAIAQCIEQPLGIVLNHTLVQEQVHSRDETIRELEDIPIQRLLQRSMKRFANRIALSESGRSLTYGELDKYSEIIAGRLLAKQGNRVIIWTDSDIESIVAIHACLKAGYTYIPIEKTTPLNRVKQIIDDCKPSHQLFSPGTKVVFSKRIESITVDIQLLDESETKSSSYVPRNLNEIAYVIYTSGSSGSPKGVEISIGSLSHYLFSVLDIYRTGIGTSIPLTSSLAFDMSVTALYLSVLQGKTLELFNDEEFYSRVLGSSQSRFEFVKLTPTQFEVINELAEARGSIDLDIFNSKQMLIFGGEVLFEKNLRHVNGTVINEYGPTETTVGCTMYIHTPSNSKGCEHTGGLPIGQPLVDVELLILDESLRVTPIGTPGELCISGPGLAQGYLNAPKMTARKFVPNPFSTAGGRMYKTGDLVRQSEDGSIYFLGRLDRQIKLNGLRIELDEIEREAMSIPFVASAVAIYNELANEDTITLYLVGVRNQNVIPKIVESKLRLVLPSYMIPATINIVANLPRMKNGKIDYSRLGDLDILNPELELEELLEYIQDLDESDVERLLLESL